MLHLILLYASLADPEFDTRERASASLLHLVDRHPATYGPRVAELACGSSCPEARARCRPVVAAYDRWRVYSYSPRGPWPICDAYPIGCPVIPFGLEDMRDRCRWPVATLPGDRGGPDWTAYRRTTEQRVRELLRQGLSHEDADALVERMRRLEAIHTGDVDQVRWAAWLSRCAR